MNSLASSASVLSDNSELSSPPPSTPSSKATTPVHVAESKDSAENGPSREDPSGDRPSKESTGDEPSKEAIGNELPESPSHTKEAAFAKVAPSRPTFDVRPRVSIPTDLATYEYAHECITAAEHSRLNPYALHQDEYRMLRGHISHAQVTTYLNIRNGILRLWLKNPRIGVARDEAVGCARDAKWFDVANVCYDWLLRRGYINYGCCELPSSKKPPKRPPPKKKGKTIVVIGAGMAGLGCARQLDALTRQYVQQFDGLGEELPRIVVIEGRNRLGGRVYSRLVDGSDSQRLLGFKGKRHSVECGGMIITGFERGNPLNVLVRGQMALPYYALRPDATLYDANGKPVDAHRDQLVEKLYNDCLDRVSHYKFKTQPSKLIEGNRGLIDEGKDSTSEIHKTIAYVEEAMAALPQAPPVSEQSLGPRVNLVPVSTDRATGRTHVEPGTPAAHKAAYKAKSMGWTLKQGVSEDDDLDLEGAAQNPCTTLGSLMDEAILQYRNIIDLTPQDYRLMNWHVANLEYSNATNYNQLSLGGWDLDAGNEWEGKHTMVVGGYQSVPWGLAYAPSQLDIHRETAVKRIAYDPENKALARVECDNGFAIDADYVVSTIPLGVLKHGNVGFDPPLPPWKVDAIGRLGYGILNKVILVYREAFWDTNRDIFGVLRNPQSRHSLKQSEYMSQRGRFFQWFNVSHTSGIPVLLALMAGDAGFDTEHSKNDELVAEATEVLQSVYGPKVPPPVHAVVTRWGSDKFARGSYSSAGPFMKADDYDTMAHPIGNLHFAGEHTTGTHPATVHGAYLSGLRAASEVIEAMLGPIEVPTPLVVPKESSLASPAGGIKRKEPESTFFSAPPGAKQARIEAHENEARVHIYTRIGSPPPRPAKVTGNAYLLYSKVNFEIARKRCEEGRRPGKGKPGPNEVRVMTSKMWKEAAPEEKRPFEEEAAEQKKTYAANVKTWEEAVKDWERRALEVRQAWEQDGHKMVLDDDGSGDSSTREKEGHDVGTYVESDGSDVEMQVA